MSAVKYALEVKNLKKNYGSKEVLKGISFAVEKGEIFALLGVNGAGKTTALECIEGLRKYDSGNISLIGKKGIQLQSSSLPAFIKPSEAIKLFSKWNKTKPNIEIIKSLGVNEFYQKTYYKLSTGQKKRLHLALALIGDPDIVFLDEPTSGLDVEGRISLHDEIKKLRNNGKTVVLASHDMAEVETLSNRIGILNKGELSFLGTVDELSEKMCKLFTIKIRTANGIRSYQCSDVGKTLYEILEDCKEKSVIVNDIKIQRGSLEEHLISIARGDDK